MDGKLGLDVAGTGVEAGGGRADKHEVHCKDLIDKTVVDRVGTRIDKKNMEMVFQYPHNKPSFLSVAVMMDLKKRIKLSRFK